MGQIVKQAYKGDKLHMIAIYQLDSQNNWTTSICQYGKVSLRMPLVKQELFTLPEHCIHPRFLV